MTKTIIFFVTIILVVVLVFLYISGKPTSVKEGILPEKVSDATKSERCAQFEEVVSDEDGEEVRSIGYGSRIKQVLNGCF